MELADLIEHILKSGELKKMDALKLSGRVQFAAGQLFGRIARKSLSVVTQHAYHSEPAALSPSATSALRRFKDMLIASAPQSISTRSFGTWLIFTDALHEPQTDKPCAGVGAVLVDAWGKKQRFFSQELGAALLEGINVSHRKTVILECELFTVLCALQVRCNIISECDVVLHTDNDAVRDCFISCHTDSLNTQKILEACITIEANSGRNIWIPRVPTESNIADGPSRLHTANLLQCGCVEDKIECEQIWKDVVLSARHCLGQKRGRHQTRLSSPASKKMSLHCEGQQDAT